MKKLTSRRPSPAMMVALLALFVAMGGTGYAAVTITGKNVKNSSLTGKDVKNSSLTGKDVKKNSLTGSDVSESKLGQVPSAAKATNADHATTADSATTAGDAQNLGGTPAADHLRNIHMVVSTSASNSTSPKTAIAGCPAGEEIVGGGGFLGGTPTAPENVVIQEAYPAQSFTFLGLNFPDEFVAKGVETDLDGGNWTVTARALCAKG